MNGTRYDKMAVDFGTSNTVVAFWDDDREDVVLHQVPDVTRTFQFQENGRKQEIPCIPSLIYYQDARTSFIGSQGIQKTLENGRGAFRWIKAYLQKGWRAGLRVANGEEVINYSRAGRDFLDRILTFAAESGHVDLESSEVAFTVPVEGFESYTAWLSETCLDMGVRRYRFIDESSACIFGYDTQLRAGDVFLIFDLGGGTLDISVVRIEEQVRSGRGCAVLGKAGCQIGGRTIDGLLYKELLRRAKIQDVDARSASPLFMLEVERLKEELSRIEHCSYDIRHEGTGLRLNGIFYRSELEDLMEENHLYHHVRTTIERALADAEERGVRQEDIKEALMVGGASHIPGIRMQVSRLFGPKTRFYRPYDAVARGACRYLSTEVESLYDHIQHDYAIKGYDKDAASHTFIPLIPRGTTYPTDRDFKKFVIKPARRGQRFFGIDIYELADKASSPSGIGEVVFDPNGGVVFDDRFHEDTRATEFWMNEGNPTLIEAKPVGEGNGPRFEVGFRVNERKRLLVTVWDLLDRKLIYDDYPVVKLR